MRIGHNAKKWCALIRETALLRCVTSEDKVAILGGTAAREAGFELRLVCRFAISSKSEGTPEPAVAVNRFESLSVRTAGTPLGAGPATKDWARPKTLLFSSDATSFQAMRAMTVPSRNGSFVFAIRLDRYVVAEDGSNVIEAAFFVSHGDQSPVAVPGKGLYPEDGGGALHLRVQMQEKVEPTTPTTARTATSKKAIRFIWLLPLRTTTSFF